jgi:hypothetical protein
MKRSVIPHKKVIKPLVFLFLSSTLSVPQHIQTDVPYRAIFTGTMIGVTSCGACLASVIVHYKKKLQNKLVLRNDQLNAYYIKHERYLHLFVQRNSNHQKQKSCIFYLHGIGGHNKEFKTLFSQEKQYFLDHADYIIPCIEFTNHIHSYFAPFFNTDFGQEQDLLTALDALKNLFLKHVNRYEKLIIMGRSRGGAITTNVIGVLSTKGHSLLEKSGISEAERLLILQKLVTGGIILITPLISLQHAIQKRFGNFLGSFLYRTMFSSITRDLYHPISELKPLFMIQRWNNDMIPVSLIMALDDEVVGTKYNEHFLKKIEKYNGISPEIIYITGGHNSKEIYHHNISLLDKIFFSDKADNAESVFDYCTV